MKNVLWLILLGLIAGAVVLSANVSTIPADKYSIPVISLQKFAGIKAPFIAFSQSHKKHGVFYSETKSGDTLSVYCKKVPLVVLSNGPGEMYLLTFFDQAQRAPGMAVLVENSLEEMRKLGPVISKRGENKPTEVDAVVLKYRDGIDLDLKCEG